MLKVTVSAFHSLKREKCSFHQVSKSLLTVCVCVLTISNSMLMAPYIAIYHLNV